MPEYTREEIEDLKNNLRYIRLIYGTINGTITKSLNYKGITKEDVESDQCFVIITIDKRDERVRVNRLFDLLDRNIAGYSQSTIDTLISFLFFTELREVPLFINKIPEFANWRLRIEK